MATARPFAYNTSGTIAGTTQVGNLAVGFPTSGFTDSPQFWNGPDEELGYVISVPVSGNTQPTQVPNDALFLSTTYKGTDISLSNNNQTATQIFGYQESVLGETIISGSNKVMFSVLCNLLEPQTLIGSHVIGVGTTSMNYSSQYGSYPGNDIYSIGFSDDGNYYFDGSSVQSGLPTWTDGDTIDIAIAAGQYWWIRVNGGDWNNNPTANPATNSGGVLMNGLTSFYPVLCPSYQGIMTVLNYPKYGVPSEFNFLGNVTASVGFFRTSGFNDNEFVQLANTVSNSNYTTASEASSGLTTNGYWNSYGVVTSNLELYLNPNDSSSYPNSGTTWYDLSGLSHDTTLEGNPTLPTFVSSPIKSFLFAQSGAYGSANRANTSSNFLGDDMTLQCWINTTLVGNDTAHYRLMYIMGAEVGGTGNDWGFGVNNSGKLAFGNGTNDVTINTTASVNTGAWINVAVTRTKSTGSISLYINGVLDITSTGPTSGNTLNAASQIWVGCGQDGPSTSFGGNIGSVLAYSSVLNDSEILTNYNVSKSTYGY